MYLREATLDDCAFLPTLFDNEEYERYFAENSTTEAEWRDRFDFFRNQCNLIVCGDDGGPIGWLTYQLTGDVCMIGIIVIKHPLVGSGLGYQAFDQVVRSLPPTVKKVKLDVQQRNAHAVAFYKRYGFHIVSEEVQPVGDGTQLYYNMELDR